MCPLLAVNSIMKINAEVVPIDPLLFQRISVMKKSDEDLQKFFNMS